MLDPKVKARVLQMLDDGKSYSQIERETKVKRGTIGYLKNKRKQVPQVELKDIRSDVNGIGYQMSQMKKKMKELAGKMIHSKSPIGSVDRVLYEPGLTATPNPIQWNYTCSLDAITDKDDKGQDDNSWIDDASQSMKDDSNRQSKELLEMLKSGRVKPTITDNDDDIDVETELKRYWDGRNKEARDEDDIRN